MTWLGPESAGSVVVPDVVGLTVSIAREVAWEAGVVLAAADPDGPSLRELTWQGEWTVTGQSLKPGSVMRYRGSLVIRFRPGGPSGGSPGTAPFEGDPGDEAGDREPRTPKPPPGMLGAERDEFEAGGESGDELPVSRRG